MNEQIEYATKRLIDSVWTMAYRHVEGGVELLAYSRRIDLGYEREQELPKASLLERNGREVYAIQMHAKHDSGCMYDLGEPIPVVNPRYVFDYPEQPPLATGEVA